MNFFGKKTVKKYIDPLEPIPVGQVVEGNAESDWSDWEDSVAFQDSQMSEFHVPTVPMPLQATVQTTENDPSDDAYASVTRNSP